MVTEAELNRLITDNMGLVPVVAADFRGRGIDFEDLLAIGREGLVISARSYDPKKWKFPTWASLKIRDQIQDAIKSGNYHRVGEEIDNEKDYQWDSGGFAIYEPWPEDFDGSPETLTILFGEIKDKQAKFEQAFMSLTPIQRKLIMLVFLRDPAMSVPEAARELRISYLKSWRAIKRGLFRMRKVITSIEANRGVELAA